MRKFIRLNENVVGTAIMPIWIDPEIVVAISGKYDSKQNKYRSLVTLQRTPFAILVEEKPEEVAKKCGIKLPLEAV